MIQNVLITLGAEPHVAVAIAEEIQRRIPNARLYFAGSDGERGETPMNQVDLRALRATYVPVHVHPFRGTDWRTLAAGLSRAPFAARECRAVLKRVRPDVVIGCGGPVTGAMLATASALGMRTAVVETQEEATLTSRVLAPVVDAAFVTETKAARCFRSEIVRTIDLPLRRSVIEAGRRLATDPDGARARAAEICIRASEADAGFSTALIDELTALGVDESQIRVLPVTGGPMVLRAFRAMFLVSRPTRRGLEEVCATGVPALFVASPGEKSPRAEELARVGAIAFVNESRLDDVRHALARFVGNETYRERLGQSAHALARTDGAACVVDAVERWLGEGGHDRLETDDEGDWVMAGHAGGANAPAARVPYRVVPANRHRKRRRNSSVPPHRRVAGAGDLDPSS